MKKVKLTVDLEFNENEIKTLTKEADLIKMNLNEYISFKVNSHFFLELVRIRQKNERNERLLKMKKGKENENFAGESFEKGLI